MIFRALATACLLAIATGAHAGRLVVQPVFYEVELDATSYTYYLHGPVKAGSSNATTSGSSATVTAISGTPFDDVAVGDMLIFSDPYSPPTYRIITAKASGASITVDAAITLDGPPNAAAVGYPFSYRTLTSGTGAADGWVLVGGLTNKLLSLYISQLNVTGAIYFSVECRVDSVGPIRLFEANYASAALGSNGEAWPVTEDCTHLRVGIKIDSADDGGDLTTNREKVFAILTGEER